MLSIPQKRLTIIGCSNMRNAYVAHGRKSTNKYGFPVEFHPATSLHVGLEQLSRAAASKELMVMVDFITNGLVDAVDMMMEGPEFDQEITKTLKSYTDSITEASKYVGVMVVILPMFRAFPKWLPAKHGSICDAIKDLLRDTNANIIPPMHITEDGLNTDGVHLNPASLMNYNTHMMQAAFGRDWTPLKGLKMKIANNDGVISTPSSSRKRRNVGGEVIETEKPKHPRTVIPLPNFEDTGVEEANFNFGASTSASTNPFGYDGPEMETEVDGVDRTQASPALRQLSDIASGSLPDPGSHTRGLPAADSDIDFGALPGGMERVLAVIKAEFVAGREHTSGLFARVLEVKAMVTDCVAPDISALLQQAADSADNADLAINTQNEHVVIVSGIQTATFPQVRNAEECVILLFGQLKQPNLKFPRVFVLDFPAPRPGYKKDLKLTFENAGMARQFRVAANKLRVGKVGLWRDTFVSTLVTKATRVRVSLMMSLAKKLIGYPNHRSQKITVSRFDSRPKLFFRVGDGDGERVIRTMCFCDAMAKYGKILTPEDKGVAKKIAGRSFGARLKPLFMVLD